MKRPSSSAHLSFCFEHLLWYSISFRESPSATFEKKMKHHYYVWNEILYNFWLQSLIHFGNPCSFSDWWSSHHYGSKLQNHRINCCFQCRRVLQKEIKLDPAGSTAHYEVMKLCTGQYRTLWGGSSCQSGKKCGVSSHRTCNHFLAHSAYFNNFWQKIPYFDASRQKRVLFNCFATKQCLGMLKMWG